MTSQMPHIRRRDAVVGAASVAGAACAAYVLRGPQMIAEALSAQPASAAGVCTLTKEVTEGPYWIDTALTRRNITEGKSGTKLALYIKVVDATTCKAIKGADVEIWHADATGEYSGFDGSSSSGGPGGGGAQTSTRYLRGHQKSDALGRVHFDTIYPGWYQGRTPHIHVKVHVGGKEIHTGQIFFTAATSKSIYRRGAYKARGQASTTNSSDNIYAQAGRSSVAKVTARGGSRGYRGTITLGVS